MNATLPSAYAFRPHGRPGSAVPRQRLSRNAAIVLSVLAFHVGVLWALQNGLLQRTAELVVPAEILTQLIELPPPKAKAVPTPPVPEPAQPAAPAQPAPRKAAAKPPTPQPPKPQPLAVPDPTPSPSVPIAAAPAPAAPPAPVATAPSAAPATAVAAAPSAATTGPAVQMPSSDADYLHNPKPPYPSISRKLGEQGKVIVRVLIGPDGQAQKSEIRQSSGFERLDEAATATVMRWRYVPGKRNGVAEAMWFNVPISFVLD